MAIVVRYQCYGCGAPCEARGGAAWIRCGHCRALLGFDYQAWFESKDYQRWLSTAAANAGRWPAFQKLEAEAAELGKKGALDEALAREREAQAMLVELTPHVFPPEARTDAVYREKYLATHAWLNVQLKVDREAERLYGQMMALFPRFDLRDPMKVLRPAGALLDRLMLRLATLPGCPPDPDGMPPKLRMRVFSASFLSAYLGMISRMDDKLEVLRSIHGIDNVKGVGDAAEDDTGLYKDWRCPSCGAVSLQYRGVAELTCLGCMFRIAAGSGRDELPAAALKCPTCGADIQVAEGELEGSCAYCNVPVRRMAVTGDAYREFQKEALRGFGGGRPPGQGAAGLEVTAENRAQRVLAGLLRTANFYATLVAPERYVTTVRKAFPDLADADRARKLDEVEAQAGKAVVEGIQPAAKELLQKARRLLDPNRR